MHVRPFCTLAIALIGLSPACALAAEPDATIPATPVVARVKSTDDSPQRLREGSKLTDVVGQFDFAGDRIAFFPADSKDSFRVLENLALERVSRVLGESRAKPEWSVSGVITEFRGLNYLLVTKAVIVTPAAKPIGP